MQNQNSPYTPFMSWVHRDASGIQESQSNSAYSFNAYDPLGNPIYNVQPPITGPPPYVPFYGATYGGASWNSFSLANNLAAGCNYLGTPMDCSSAMIKTMGLEFASNLPGFYLDNAYAEQGYANYVRAASVQKPKGPPTLKPAQKQKRNHAEIVRLRNENAWVGDDEGDPQNSGGEQLSPCLRDALRQYFPQQSAQGKSYSPIDNARFKGGIPGWVKAGVAITPGAVNPAAITLGLYDIHYDNSVNISGGGVNSLETVIEEVSHTVQFLQVWAGLKKNMMVMGKWGIDTTDYNAAKSAWQDHYAYYAVKGLGYDNEVERWAKGNVESIMTSLRQGGRGELCGFDLYPRSR